MNIPVSVTITGDQYDALQRHLFPGDGLEAVAFLACGRAAGSERHRLVVRFVHFIPHERCHREKNRINWKAEDLELLLDQAEAEGLSLIKVHSHPGGYPKFSRVDDASDAELLPTIKSWIEKDVPHGSVIMLPDGSMFGRYVWKNHELKNIALINVVGSDLKFWWDSFNPKSAVLMSASQDQAFGEGTTARLARMCIGVVGASGTGSPHIEQLIRLGVGHIVIIDDDFVEERNLNRIMFATADHASRRIDKVAAAEEDILRKGLCTRVTTINKSIATPEVIRALSQCDVVFGCVDTASGRFILNLTATYYNLAYFDTGVLLDAQQDGEGRGQIKDILGTVHYLVPGRSSLLSRGVFTIADVAAEELHKRDPRAAEQQVQDKYIKGMAVRRPAVVSVNMFAAALSVNDFLARLHPYRRLPNKDIGSIEFSLGELRLTADEEMESCPAFYPLVGKGDCSPWLGLPQLGAL